MKYLIIGGGIAGVTAAEEIRKNDTEGEITLLDGEQHALYSRVLLPHYVKAKIPREKVFLKKEEWYAAQRIDWQRGVHAVQIDTTHRFVRTSEERELPYDKLLIVTGGEVRLLSQDLRGVSYFRTLDDADHLLELVRTQKEISSGVVYGSGFISFEYINIFAHFGMPTTVVMRSGGFFSRTLSPASQNVLSSLVVKHGVTLVTDAQITDLVGEKELTGVRLNDERELPCSILGVGIGIEPDETMLEQAGIAYDQGIIANERFETNIPDVYAAGDVAKAMDTVAQRNIMAGNWMSALMQGRTVGKIMTGQDAKMEIVSSYATNLLGKEMVVIGDTHREFADQIVVESDEENALELFIRGGKTVGAILIGDVRERQKITQAIKDRSLYAR